MTRGSAILIGVLSALCSLTAAIAIPTLRTALMERLPSTWSTYLSALRNGVHVDHDVHIAMRDGVRLSASLYVPKGANKPMPTILVRVPYHRLRYDEGRNAGVFFASRGYAVLVQDLRGTGDSGGELLPWRDVASDGVATLDWIAKQPWSTGKVGTFGCSALGETQLVLAAQNHPAHAAMIPSGAGGAVGSVAGRYGYFGLFEGGVFQLASGFGWFVDSGPKDPKAPAAAPFVHKELLRNLPVSGLVESVRPVPSGYTDFLRTPLGDPRWGQWGYLSESDFSRVPALVINTWGDQTVGDSLALAEAWRKSGFQSNSKVVVGPGQHCYHERPESTPGHFGELQITASDRPWKEWYLRWFDHWLRGRPDDFHDLKAFNYFMLVENRWRESDSWPPSEARVQRWHLGGNGHANSRKGDGTLSASAPLVAASDSFRYDPAVPVPSRGGPVCCTGDPNDRPGPADQADVEIREDVLVYTSEPLVEDLRIAGPLKAHLTVSSDALDTDLVLRLVHVWPDGRALAMQEGALRLRYRASFRRPELMKPGKRYDVTVDLRSIAYMIPKGHRLRLQVTSSSFPRLERNLNTGAANNADEIHGVVAVNDVHHGPGSTSYVELPVIDAAP